MHRATVDGGLVTTAGGSAAYQVALASINGFVRDETLTVTGLPAAVGTASVASYVISTVGTAVLTVSTLGTAALGNYQLQATAAAGTISHSTTVTLTVICRPDFTVTAAPTTDRSRPVLRPGSRSPSRRPTGSRHR